MRRLLVGVGLAALVAGTQARAQSFEAALAGAATRPG